MSLIPGAGEENLRLGITPESRRRRILLGLGLGVLLTVAAGCSTDENVGGFQPSCLTFLATKAPINEEVTSVWGSESTCDTAEVELVIPGGVDKVWGASFHVTYDNSLTVFAGMSTTDSFFCRTSRMIKTARS
jgi:hypothetical protein